MRIAVIGAGAMGGLFGARLALGGQEVSLIDASEPTIQAIKRQGLILKSHGGSNTVMLPVGRADDFQNPFDLLIIFTKGFHTSAAIESVKHLVGPNTWAMSVQNGLGNAERIAAVVPNERIIVGMTNFPADLIEPGVVSSHGEGHINIWTASGEDDANVHHIAEAFTEAGLECIANPDVQVAIWEKVAFNAALNSLCAVSGLTVGGVGKSEQGRSLASQIIKETVAVANASGIAAQQSNVATAIQHAFDNHVSHKPSMLQDVEARRRTEIDFINGAVADRGRNAGVDTPVLRTLGDLVKLIESGY